MGYYLTIKNETLPFVVTWMDLETIILSEVSQMEGRQIPYFSHMWILKKEKQNKYKLIDIQRTD